MKQLLCVLCFTMLVCCTNKNNVIGTYKAVDDSALLKSIVFDGEVASFKGGFFNLMPSFDYEVKNNTVYIKTAKGMFLFEIIDNYTIKGKTSIYDGVYKKQ